MRAYFLIYIVAYIFFCTVSLLWLKTFFNIKSNRFFLTTFLANLSFLSIFNFGFLISAMSGAGLLIQYLGGVTFTLGLGFIAKHFITTKLLQTSFLRKPKFLIFFSNHPDKSYKLKLIYWFTVFFIMILAVTLSARHYAYADFAWDEIFYWVPRMKEIALGNFASTLNFGFGSYPPFWMITGAHALLINDIFLYLIPVFFLVHLLLAIADFLSDLPRAKQSLLLYIIFIPTIVNFYRGIQTFELYANFFVAILLVWAYLLDGYKHLLNFQILITLLLAAAVLSRPDTIIFVAILHGINLLQAVRRSDREIIKYLLVSMVVVTSCYFLWTFYCRYQGIGNRTFDYMVAGVQQLISDPSLIQVKISGIISFIYNNSRPTGWWWFVPIYLLLVTFSRIRESKHWVAINVACLVYLVLQYMLVPLNSVSTINWWMTTGFFRMFGNFSLWIFIDLLIRLGNVNLKLDKLKNKK